MRARRGFTTSELVAELSALHGLRPSGSFRRQVALALRRGLAYGILVRSGNEYRFDPERALEGSPARRRRRSGRRRGPGVPRPTVPPPPDFRPKPRDLTREPFRVIRHRRPAPRK